MENSGTSVLHRKISGSAHAEGGGDRPMIRALRLALARVSRDRLGLPVDVIGATLTAHPADAVAAQLPKEALLLQLGGPQAATGAIALAPALVSALIQQQTFGAVSALDGDGRAFTDTDAALCAPVMTAALAQAAELAERAEDRDCLHGHGFRARGLDPGSVAVALEGKHFHVFDFTLDIGTGTGQGRLMLVLPDRPMPAEDEAGPSGAKAAATLADAALNAAVRLNAVMCRVPLTVSELEALALGDLLPLPAYRLDRTELLTMSGQLAGAGRLGRVEGLRAVRVNETTTPEADFAGAPAAADPDVSQLAPTYLSPSVAAGPPGAPVAENDDDLALDQMGQDEAMKRISELAGLSGEPDPTADTEQEHT